MLLFIFIYFKLKQLFIFKKKKKLKQSSDQKWALSPFTSIQSFHSQLRGSTLLLLIME